MITENCDLTFKECGNTVLQSNLSATGTLGTHENGHNRDVERLKQSKSMYGQSAETKTSCLAVSGGSTVLFGSVYS